MWRWRWRRGFLRKSHDKEDEGGVEENICDNHESLFVIIQEMTFIYDLGLARCKKLVLR